MIFAKVDVELRDHERAHRAGPAMATWTWALLWTRAKERNGFVASEALRGAWVGEKTAARDMARLVACGLVAPVDGGWQILHYEEKNDTREDVEARKATQRERKAKWDAKRRGNALPTRSGNALPTSEQRGGNATEPEPEPEPDLPLRGSLPACTGARDPGPAAPSASSGPALAAVDLDAPMPGWASERAAALEISLGPSTLVLASEWASYVAHVAARRAEARPTALDPAGWQAWLTRARTFARRDADRARGRSGRVVQRDPEGPSFPVAPEGEL